MIQYILTDGHGSFIRYDTFTGKYVPIKNESFAEKWKQRDKAKNILKNCLTKQLQGKYHVDEVDDGTGICGLPIKKTVSEVNANATVDLHIDEVKQLIIEKFEDTQISKWESGIETMSDFVQDAELRREKLAKDLSDVDKEIIDIQHYIEFNDMNAYQGWLAYKMLQNRLRERRKVKNELKILTQLGNCKVDSAMLGEIKNAIGEMDNRVYIPRKLTQLFS